MNFYLCKCGHLEELFDRDPHEFECPLCGRVGCVIPDELYEEIKERGRENRTD